MNGISVAVSSLFLKMQYSLKLYMIKIMMIKMKKMIMIFQSKMNTVNYLFIFLCN